MSLKLYGYWRSSASWRVRWAAEHHGVALEHVAVNLKTGEQKQEAYRSLNPAGLVPYLELANGRRISQSLAQIFLINAMPAAKGASLLPEDQFEMLKSLELWEIIAADTHPIQNISVQFRHSNDPAERRKWAQEFITRGLRNFEAASNDTIEQWSVGSRVSIADLALVPQIYNGLRFGVNVASEFSSLFSLYKRALETPDCRAASPEEQHDAEPSV